MVICGGNLSNPVCERLSLYIRPPRKDTVFLFYHIVPGILIKLLKLNLKKKLLYNFLMFLYQPSGGSMVNQSYGEVLWRDYFFCKF